MSTPLSTWRVSSQKPTGPPEQSWRLLVTRLLGDWHWLVLGLLMLAMTNVLRTWLPLAFKQLLESLEPGAALVYWHTLWQDHLYPMLGVIVAMLLVRIASRMLLLGVAHRLEAALRQQVFDRLLCLPPAFYDVNSTGEVMSRLTNDLKAVRFMVGGGIMLVFNTLFAYGATLPAMWQLNAPLTLACGLLYPITLAAIALLSRQVKASFQQVQALLGQITSRIQENLSAIHVIQSYAIEPWETKRFSQLGERYFQASHTLIHSRIWLYLLMSLVTGLGLLLVLWVGGQQALAGQFHRTDFVAFTLYLEALAWPTLSLGWAVTLVQQGRVAWGRVTELLQVPVPSQALLPIETHFSEAMLQAEAQGVAVSVEKLTFAYEPTYQPLQPESTSTDPEQPSLAVLKDNQPSRLVLNEVSFQVPVGSLVALIGPVGAGKSTLLRLIAKRYPVPKRSIFLNNHDLAHIPAADVAAWVSLMPQSSLLFSASMAENLRFGSPQVDGAAVETMADLSQLRADIDRMPQQLETLVGQRGLSLSGGQRQRVSLARTLLRDSPLLLLDDPFASVDADTERRLINALQQWRFQTVRPKTVLFASHRMPWVHLADHVVFLSQGKVLAQGTHRELLGGVAAYRAFVQECDHSFDCAQDEPTELRAVADPAEVFSE
ncbi:MAG: ABC transporter ATP-binding protein [Candidatus Melainabacteria bacterium]|nr:ABC transporter ATP-binding protein [Candidatus Melainabacteria bacterium]